MPERVEWVVRCPSGEEATFSTQEAARVLARDFDADKHAPCFGRGSHEVFSRPAPEAPNAD